MVFSLPRTGVDWKGAEWTRVKHGSEWTVDRELERTFESGLEWTNELEWTGSWTWWNHCPWKVNRSGPVDSCGPRIGVDCEPGVDNSEPCSPPQYTFSVLHTVHWMCTGVDCRCLLNRVDHRLDYRREYTMDCKEPWTGVDLRLEWTGVECVLEWTVDSNGVSTPFESTVHSSTHSTPVHSNGPHWVSGPD